MQRQEEKLSHGQMRRIIIITIIRRIAIRCIYRALGNLVLELIC